ncbi:signal recognition particle-docking protein FtsY [Buchnera aphidicola]|uniref:signal recognition particle-docking protein FtsY n=1 Tax=Buchnera aphidicola TaxID=9 RepID=UPI00094D12EC|nr:signal recognition particle-docking protein FtsY [Buchnera aphidicola]
MSKDDKNRIRKFFSWSNLKKVFSIKSKNADAKICHERKIFKDNELNNVFQNVKTNKNLNNLKNSLGNEENIKNRSLGTQHLKKNKILSILAEKLLKTKNSLGSKIQLLFSKNKIEQSCYEDISNQLLMSDVGVETSRELVNSLIRESRLKKISDSKDVFELLKKNMINILKKVEIPLNIIPKKPFSILVVGINGVGKTSMIGKLTRYFKNQGKSVMLAAGDTFRAAAIDQLKILGEKNLVSVIARQCKSDPASVIFDACEAAKSKKIDILIADTAGRLHNNIDLIEELKKIKRVMKKIDSSAPDEIILVLDACIGQNSIKQAKIFNEALGITGLAITKLDGTAKGGIIFSIANQLSIPIRYISFGEKLSDLQDFNSENFVDAIFLKDI